MSESLGPLRYSGDYYAEIGNFLREEYLQYPFTWGTRDEVDFLVDMMGLPRGAHILDVGCGAGRHSLELARRGYNTTGVDISEGLIGVAKRGAQEEDLEAEFYVGDARSLEFAPEFDGAICLCQGAFGIAGDDDAHVRVLKGIARSLRNGAPFVLSAINALALARRISENNDFDALSLTQREAITIRNPEGDERQTEVFTTAFTARELKWLLREAGFQIEEVFGGTAGQYSPKSLEIDDFEIVVLAKRA